MLSKIYWISKDFVVPRGKIRGLFGFENLSSGHHENPQFHGILSDDAEMFQSDPKWFCDGTLSPENFTKICS